MNREQIMSVLYDIALVIGGEVSVRPLLTKTVQRLLYHTSFPTGLVCLDVPDGGGDTIETTLDAAVGDFGFAGLVGSRIELPAQLLRGGPEVCEAPALLAGLSAATRTYTVFLRLPIDHQGVLLLLAPRRPSTQLPLTEIFRPVMANLAKAILLCRHNDAYTAGLQAERDEAQRFQAESEKKFRSMATAAQDAIVMIDHEGRINYWNPAAERIFGYRADEVVGHDAHSRLAPERYRQLFHEGFARFTDSGHGPLIGKTIEIEALRKDGREFPVEVSISAFKLQGRWHAVGLLRDITERRQAEQALLRANRTLKTLSGCNGILVRATDESHLLHDICSLIVDTGGYRSAWVGYECENGKRCLSPVASAGEDRDFIGNLDIDLDDRSTAAGPAARAFLTGKTQLVQDLAADDNYPAHRNDALQRGIAAAIALPLLDGGTPFGVLKVYAEAREAFNAEEVALLTELSEDLAFGIVTLRGRRERERLEAAEHEGAERLKRALLGTIQAVALTVEKRDPYTAGHQQRTAQLAVAIARELGWPEDRIEGVRLGAMIHDIGKVYVPAEILNRPGRLSELEYGLIKAHPEVGYEILKDVELPWPVAQIILQHHERLDGSGYPKGLADGAIIPEARLLAIADVVEAMAAHRPYRPALGLEAALGEITRQRGTLFDPEMVDACLKVLRERGFSFG